MAGNYFKVIDGVAHTVSVNMTNPPPLPMHIAYTGAPYSGDEIEERVQTLTDGSRLTQRRLTTRTYRDSKGRVRTEMFPPTVDPDSHPAALSISIQDPVANVQYRLEVRAMVAQRWDLSKIPTPETMILAPVGISHGEGLPPSPPPRSMPADYSPAPPAARPELPPRPPGAAAPPPNMGTMRSESLGTTVIEGVTVEGLRTTRTLPLSADGSDRPLSTVTEQWTAPELHVTVLSKTTDPRLGETTRSLIHLSREEPDISLFQPPPDYTIVDQQVRITINHQVRP
jgi:hypothetical protein